MESPRATSRSVRLRASLGLAAIVAFAALAGGGSEALADVPQGEQAAESESSAVPRVFWRERFAGPSLDWLDPQSKPASELARVYGLSKEGGVSFLHARHDASGQSPPKAMHYGFAFEKSKRGAPALEDVGALTWKWRVREHPAVGGDAWQDVAASVYVVTKVPSLFSNGKGFKFGWLAHAGATRQTQHGILEVELRHDAAGPGWRTETVDLCGLYRKNFGSCEGERVLYVGVVTDADGTKSVADADYADFALVAK